MQSSAECSQQLRRDLPCAPEMRCIQIQARSKRTLKTDLNVEVVALQRHARGGQHRLCARDITLALRPKEERKVAEKVKHLASLSVFGGAAVSERCGRL